MSSPAAAVPQPSPSVVNARLLLPDDANPAGNVHGGTILKLMEEAGMITATRHVNNTNSSSQALTTAHDKDSDPDKADANCIAALIRFETMSFLKPVFVGELASCRCQIIFTSNSSILVEVVVIAENFMKGTTRTTNTGQLWYVPMVPTITISNDDSNKKIIDWKNPKVSSQVPPITPQGEVEMEKFAKAKMDYEKRKTNQHTTKKQKIDKDGGDVDNTSDNDEGYENFKRQHIADSERWTLTDDIPYRSSHESEQVLSQIVLPGDCFKGNVAFGGFVMKLMDNAAGCSAYRFCRTNVVTVGIKAMDFVSWVHLGDLCSIQSKVVFASTKSIEIEVIASVTSTKDFGIDRIVAKGLFSFVSLSSDKQVLPVPKLRCDTDEEIQNAYLGQQRYEEAKRARRLTLKSK